MLDTAQSFAQTSHDRDAKSRHITREQRVSRQQPCVHCDAISFCIRDLGDGSSWCRTVGAREQWTDAFQGGYLHYAEERPALRPLHSLPHPATAATALAAPDVVDAVYIFTFAGLPLSDAHRAVMKGPGHNLADEQIDLYYSLPADPARRREIATAAAAQFGEDVVLQVPGFYRHHGALTFCWGGGIIMPRRDLDDRMTGFQIRSDKPDADPRYTWGSSAGFGGPSSGAAPHIAWPSELRDPHRVIVCEGIKKANALAAHFGCVVIGIAGVGTVNFAPPLFDALADRGVDVCVLALDQDIKPKAVAAVERARESLTAAATERGYAVRLASWDPAIAKGPDDLIVAGGAFTLTRYCPQASIPRRVRPRKMYDQRAHRLLETDGTPTPTMSREDMQHVIDTQRAELADCKQQIIAWEHLVANPVLPDKVKRTLAFLHKRHGTPLGRPLPPAMPCSFFPDTQDLAAEGIALTAFKESVDTMLSMDLLNREKRQKTHTDPDTPAPRERGKNWFYLYGLNGPAINALWAQLPTLAEIPLTERQVKADLSRHERLQKAIDQEKPTPEVVRALKHDVKIERHERQQVAYERDVLQIEHSQALTALQQAEHIIQDNQRQAAAAERVMCRAGCGSFIRATEWCCDECREREQEEQHDSKLDSDSKYTNGSTVRINGLDSNFESPVEQERPPEPRERCTTCHSRSYRWSDRWHEWTCEVCYPAPPPVPLHRTASAPSATGGS